MSNRFESNKNYVYEKLSDMDCFEQNDCQLYSQNRIGILILTFPYVGSWFFWICDVKSLNVGDRF